MVDAASGGDGGGELREKRSAEWGWKRRIEISYRRREASDYFGDGGSDKAIVETCCKELVNDSCWTTIVWSMSEISSRGVVENLQTTY